MKTRRKPGTRATASGDTFSETVRLMRLDGQMVELGSPRDQVYSYEADDGWQFHWSIVEAMKRAKAQGELDTFAGDSDRSTTVSLQDAGMTKALARLMNQGLDETFALSTDLTKPLLFVPFYPERDTDGNDTGKCVHLLVDGWHRVFHALHIGVDILPCYILTETDANASLIIRLPPGKGLPFEDGLEQASYL